MVPVVSWWIDSQISTKQGSKWRVETTPKSELFALGPKFTGILWWIRLKPYPYKFLLWVVCTGWIPLGTKASFERKVRKRVRLTPSKKICGLSGCRHPKDLWTVGVQAPEGNTVDTVYSWWSGNLVFLKLWKEWLEAWSKMFRKSYFLWTDRRIRDPRPTYIFGFPFGNLLHTIALF